MVCEEHPFAHHMNHFFSDYKAFDITSRIFVKRSLSRAASGVSTLSVSGRLQAPQ